MIHVIRVGKGLNELERGLIGYYVHSQWVKAGLVLPAQAQNECNPHIAVRHRMEDWLVAILSSCYMALKG